MTTEIQSFYQKNCFRSLKMFLRTVNWRKIILWVTKNSVNYYKNTTIIIDLEDARLETLNTAIKYHKRTLTRPYNGSCWKATNTFILMRLLIFSLVKVDPLQCRNNKMIIKLKNNSKNLWKNTKERISPLVQKRKNWKIKEKIGN